MESMASSWHRSRTRSRARSWRSSATRPAHAAWASRAASGFRKSGRGIWSPSGPSARTRPRASEPLADSVEDASRRGRKVGREPVEGPNPALRHVDEAGLAKLGHVVRDRWLRDVERGCEVTDADGLLGVAQAECDLQPVRVGEGFQNLARLFDLLRARLQRGRAADATLALREHHELFHGLSLADPLTNVNGFASVASTPVYASEVPL